MSRTRILKKLRQLGSKRNREGMARFGIRSRKAFGVGASPLRSLAKTIGTDHRLADALWVSGYLEARILAALIDDPKLVTGPQMDRWASAFDNWAVCDTCCGVLFDKTPLARRKAFAWSKDRREFVKRAGFVLMATLAVHDKQATDRFFVGFFPSIQRGATDPRNFVRKAVSWSLRQIGKRNGHLRRRALGLARAIRRIDAPSARWIAGDVIRELIPSKR